ncbi:MAG: M48 family metalloprotease [Myxococcales bacterium]|nr:M48 family metalloprotease [Myxococcales bacterium]
MLYNMYRYMRVRSKARAVQDATQAVLERCKDKLRIRRTVRVLESHEVSTPFVFGWRKPTVILPVGLTEDLYTEALHFVLLHELAHVKRHDIAMNWLMTVVLPGYVYFRYPAKLLVVTSLGLSMLAAHGWDTAWEHPTRQLRGWFVVLLVSSLAGLGVVLAFWPAWSAPLQAIPPDALFGPFNVDGAWRDIVTALLQTTVVAGALLVLASRRVRAAAGPIPVSSRRSSPVVKTPRRPSGFSPNRRTIGPLSHGVAAVRRIMLSQAPGHSHFYRTKQRRRAAPRRSLGRLP